ncbi:MAG: ABC transporter permease [Bryobacteraceae bacterium]
MPIPLTYNLRNIAERRVTSLMTALGIALSVFVLVAVLALVQGLRTSFEATGGDRDLLIVRKGSTAELISVVSRTNYQDIREHTGIERDANGRPLASLEMVTVINIGDETKGEDRNFNVRAVTPAAFQLRPDLRIISGRNFEPGRREVIVGASIARRFPDAGVGKTLTFGRGGDWNVVGVFEAGRTPFNGEIWGDLNQISADYNRAGYLSSLLVRTKSGEMQALARSLEADPRFNVSAIPERQYYADQTGSAVPVQFMGTLVAVILAIGSAFAAMNTMYTAVSRRTAEIATLRVIGFTRAAILGSFLAESLVLSLMGGIVGCLLALPLNRVSTEISSYRTFSTLTFNFHVSPQVMLAGLAFSLLIGAAGGLLPASRAARTEIITALRAR